MNGTTLPQNKHKARFPSTILINGNSSKGKPLLFIHILLTVRPKKHTFKEISQFDDSKVKDKPTF